MNGGHLLEVTEVKKGLWQVTHAISGVAGYVTQTARGYLLEDIHDRALGLFDQAEDALAALGGTAAFDRSTELESA
jgi:hypothetical protein